MQEYRECYWAQVYIPTMDNLDVTDTHYDKKISDLQRRLDAQYDRIDEGEETMTELKSQIYELKKNQMIILMSRLNLMMWI